MKTWMKENKREIISNLIIYLLITATLLLIDAAIVNLAESNTKSIEYTIATPFQFNFIYIIVICGLYYALPKKLFAVLYGIFSAFFVIISFSQVIYFKIFGFLYGVSSLFYISEGAAYTSSLKLYITPKIIIAFAFIIALIILNIIFILKFQKLKAKRLINYSVIVLTIAICIIGRILILQGLGEPEKALSWRSWNNLRNIYIDFKNPNGSYKITGIYEYTFRSIYLYTKNSILPKTDEESKEEIDEYFNNNEFSNETNEYSNIFEGKNIIMIMCESIDEWQVTEQVMPTLYNIRETGLTFTNYYAPFFGTGATINSELASLSGLFQCSDFIDTVDITTNKYPYSLPNLFKEKGYTAKSVHFNAEDFYNRTTLHKNLGFEKHHALLSDPNVTVDTELDSNLAKDDYIYNLIAPKQEKKFMTFITTYTPHLPYNTENQIFQKIEIDEEKLDILTVPEDEETTVVNVLSNETDNFIKVLLQRLEEDDLLDDTVLVIFTDHYNYSYSQKEKLYEMKNTREELVYRIPLTIWSKDIESKKIPTLMQTTDVLPTLANMFGLNYNAKNYLRPDIFSSYYRELVYFANFSWYDGSTYGDDELREDETYSDNFEYVNNMISLNNAIQKLKYYSQR